MGQSQQLPPQPSMQESLYDVASAIVTTTSVRGLLNVFFLNYSLQIICKHLGAEDKLVIPHSSKMFYV